MARAEVTPRSTAFPLGWSSQRLDGSDTVLVTVDGELDRFTGPSLRDHLEWCLAGGCTRLVLDTAMITFADVGAHDLLGALGRRAIAHRCAVVVVAPGPSLERLLAILDVPPGIEVQHWDASPERGQSATAWEMWLAGGYTPGDARPPAP